MHGQGTLVTSGDGHADGHAGGHAGRGGKCEYVGGFEDDRPHGPPLTPSSLPSSLELSDTQVYVLFLDKAVSGS